MQQRAKEAMMTYRATSKVLSTDPSGLKGDTTTWEYDLATGLELRKTYADGKGTVKTYDAYNNLATVTDARGVVATYSYNLSQGLLTGINFSDGTPAQKFTYNFLGQLTAVQDASGARSISYGRYGSQLEEVQQIASSRFYLQEQRNSYGRSIGYRSRRSGSDMTVVSFAYAADGRIESASFRHDGEERKFTYGYLAGSNLLQSLAMPNKVTLTQTWEEKRDLLAEMLYTRLNSAGNKVEVTRRGYAYDALGRPISRTQDYPQQKFAREDSFDYNRRSELTGATLGEAPYAYSYDNIGNRITAQEDAESVTYEANNLNQYTQIDTDGTVFVPEYDADGNQTRIQTVTGIWKVQYNGQNRAIRYESEADSTHIITCVYDSQGRRVEKKEEKEGAVISHVRYVYRGYLQVAAYDLLAEGLPSLWQIIWDPTQDIATRPLAIRADGAYSTYGWDLTKNICETYAGATGFLGHRYAYSPYGLVSLEGDTSYQPIQWSSEVYDEELGLNYYNFRYYNPGDGRWTRRDPLDEDNEISLYVYNLNPLISNDFLGCFDLPKLEIEGTYEIAVPIPILAGGSPFINLTIGNLNGKGERSVTISGGLSWGLRLRLIKTDSSSIWSKLLKKVTFSASFYVGAEGVYRCGCISFCKVNAGIALTAGEGRRGTTGDMSRGFSLGGSAEGKAEINICSGTVKFEAEFVFTLNANLPILGLDHSWNLDYVWKVATPEYSVPSLKLFEPCE